MNQLFYLFSSFILLSGLMVIQSKNPIYSVLFLILVFFNSACLLLIIGLDFFALIFLVVYVGAIAVLFLFIVMMLNIKLAEINEKRLRYLPIGAFLGFGFLLEIFLIVDNDLVPLSEKFYSLQTTIKPIVEWSGFMETTTNIETIGLYIYTYYSGFFILAGLVLLVSMIGAIVLTLHKGIAIKRQQIFQQNTRSFSETVSRFS